ncbi:pentatricopeptide repeat-containing protein At4g16835, mitochondrial-like [Wolffia australiana]
MAELARLSRLGDAASAVKLFNSLPSRPLVAWNLLLAAHAKSPGRLPAAVAIFSAMPARDVASFNTLLSCLLRNRAAAPALRLFAAIPSPNLVSWNALLSGLALSGHLPLAQHLLSLSPSPAASLPLLLTAAASAHLAAARPAAALSLFSSLPSKPTVSYNALISGLVLNHLPHRALLLLKDMLLHTSTSPPNSSTMASALLACSKLTALHLGAQLHQLSLKLPLMADPVVGTSVLSMYYKCGDLSSARKLFDEMPVRDGGAWNAIISAHAVHGWSDRALSLFEEMARAGVPPDRVTFAGVLAACAHAGKVQVGRAVFQAMHAVHGLVPGPEHYYSVVDLLCRRGLLAEAAELIRDSGLLQGRSRVPMYGALLGAARARGEPDWAQYAAARLLEVNPRSAGAYVGLANAYMAAGNWEAAAKARKAMRDKGVEKEPGCSWVRARGQWHVFRATDRTHPELGRIRAKLGELEACLARGWHRPDMGSAGTDLAPQEQARALWGHSERLAVALALMDVPPWETIRVFKNLRVCVDCHNVTKLVSLIEGREIIVRDTSRFHHFRAGSCSCGDFW